MIDLDETITIEKLKKLVLSFRDERNWKKYHNPQDLAISLSVEAAELLELFQWKNNEEIKDFLKNSESYQKVCDELADIIIYSLDLADIIDADVSEIVQKKLETNAKKYPVEKAKGSAKKYSEL
ncbi:MAG: nucleotide pyrophosphohydrolase [Candidatus Bathyarchaeota archaeon]